MVKPNGTCKVCHNPEIDLIDQRLLGGQSYYSLAYEFAIPVKSLQRHYTEHVLRTEDINGLPVVLSLQDVLNIPLQMRERHQLIQALIHRALEPLEGRFATTGAKGGTNRKGMEYVPTAFVARLMMLEQRDEQTILKLTGLLRSDEDHEKADMVLTNQYRLLKDSLDRQLLQLAQGDPEKAAEARQQLADLLMPIEEIPRPAGAPPLQMENFATNGTGDPFTGFSFDADADEEQA